MKKVKNRFQATMYILIIYILIFELLKKLSFIL